MKKYVLLCILVSCIAFGGFGQLNYQWVKGIGAQATAEGAYNVVADKHGYIYVTGKIGGDPVDFNIYGTTPVEVDASGTGCFIAKYDSTGNCVWAKHLETGNGSGCIGQRIALDALGNIYVSGYFYGNVDFDPGPSTTSYNSINDNGGSPTVDGFIAKYLTDGSLGWAKGFGGSGSEDVVTSIAVDFSGTMLCVSGTFGSNKAVFYNTTDTLFNSGGIDAFVASFETSTGALAWINQIGGPGEDIVSDIDAGTTYLVVTGAFQDSVHFFNSNLNQDTLYGTGSPGSINAFYGKYILTYGDYGWMNNIGGGSVTGNVLGTNIVLKSDTDIYLTGIFNEDANFETVGSTSVLTLNSEGDRDVYIAKYDIGENLAWARSIGTPNESVSSASLVVDNAQKIYMAGYFTGAMDFAPSGSTSTVPDTSNGGWDIYFSKFDGADGEIMWERKVGGIMEDSVVSIAIDDNNNIYLAGDFRDTVDFNPNEGFAMRGSLPSIENMFLAKYAQGGATIKGTVYYKDLNNTTDSLTIASVGKKVRLYTQIQFDGNNALNLIEEVDIDNSGKYEFTNVPEGQYMASAVPGDYYSSPLYYLGPAYYTSGMYIDTAFLWEAAALITAQTAAPAFVANIYMVKGIPLTGAAKLGGVIMAEEAFFREVKPVAAGSVVVRKNPGHSFVANTETDDEGFYSFSGLPALTNDTCYRLYVSITGLPMVSNYNPCPGQGDSIMNLNFVVDSASIDTVASIVNSVSHVKTVETSLIVYPNPNNGFVTVEFAITEPQFVKVEAYNLLGEKVADLFNGYKPASLVQYKYNATDKGLKAGVYFLHVSIGNQQVIRKIVQVD